MFRIAGKLSVIGLVVLVLSSGRLGAAQEEDDSTLAKLRQGYAATLEALHDISISSSKEYLQLPWFPPIVKLSPRFVPQDPGPYFYRFIRSGERYGWWLYRTAEDWEKVKSTDWTVTDGATSLHVTDMRGRPHATQDGTAIKTARKVGFDVDAGSSLFFLGWHNDPNPTQAFEAATFRVTVMPVKVGEVEALEASYEAAGTTTKYWFAPSRSYLPVKVELWSARGLTNRREFSAFEKLPNGVWLARRVIETQFETEEEKDKIAFKVEWKVLNVQAKPEVDDAVFSTSLDNITEGFHVQDGVTGKEYTAGEKPSAEEGKAGEEKPGEAKPEGPKPDEPKAEEPKPDEPKGAQENTEQPAPADD